MSTRIDNHIFKFNKYNHISNTIDPSIIFDKS